MIAQGLSKSSGLLIARAIPGKSLSDTPQRRLTLAEVRHFGLPVTGLVPEVNLWRWHNFAHLWRGLRRIWLAHRLGLPTVWGQLSVVKIDGLTGQLTDYGLASLRVVTTAGVNFLASAFDNTVEPELFKYHGIGTGVAAEAIGDTALGTELTTQYNPDNTRATGSQAHSTNTYTTVGTNTLDSGTPAVTEHGILSQAATGGGTLLDRSVFSAINLTGANGDGLQTTYVYTLSSGG